MAGGAGDAQGSHDGHLLRAQQLSDMLMDMDSSTADFADNFEKYMQRAMLNSMLSESHNERLRKWYDLFAEAMEEKTEWRTGQGRRGRNRYKVTTEAAGVLSQTEHDMLKDSGFDSE